MSEFTPLQKQVLDLFKKSRLKDKFYLTGGTLLSALYLHHRRSEDLDFFSDKPFSHEEVLRFIKTIKKYLKLDSIIEQKIFDRRIFLLHNKGKLRLEFVSYEHPAIKKRKKWRGIFVDSLEDIAANKLMAFFDRNDPKDLFDLYFLLTKKGYKAQYLLRLAEKKFGVKFQESAVWNEAFKKMEDLDNLKPLLLLKNSGEQRKLLQEIKNYFLGKSRHYLHRILE